MQRAIPDPVTGALPARAGGPGSSFPLPGPNDGWSVEQYSYVGPGDLRILEYTNAEGEVTRYGYDGDEKIPSSIVVAYGTAFEIEMIPEVVDDQIVWSEDADGVRTCFDHDPVTGQLTAHRQFCGTAGQLVTTFGYHPSGELAWRRDPAQQPSGPVWAFEYYGNGRIKTETRPDGSEVHYGYDALTGGSTRTDELGNLTSTEVDHGAVAGCGTAGVPCRIETTTAPGDGVTPQVSQSVYDPSGDLIESRTSPDGGVTWNTTTYVYGPLGRLERVTDPTGVSTSYGYDDNGNVTHTARGLDAFDPSQAAVTTYDKLGRVTSSTEAPDDAGSVVTETSYDRVGRAVLEVTGGGSAVERLVRTEYLPNGLVSLTALARPDLGTGVEATTEYAYSPAGRTVCVKTLVDHTTGTYGFVGTDYDGLGRVVRSRSNLDIVSGCGDDPGDTGRWAISATGYDSAGRVGWSQSPVQYATAPADSAFDPSFVTGFAYDVMGRQVSVTVPDPSDPGVGTVTSVSCFTARGELSRSMDPAGNVTAYGYLPSGAVATVVDPRAMPTGPGDPCVAVPASATVGTTVYGYDGEGHRTSRTSFDDSGDPVVEGWSWDGAGREASYTDQLGRVSEYGSWIADGVLLARTTSTGSTSDLGDLSGSSRRVEMSASYPSGRLGGSWAFRVDATDTVAESYVTSYTYDQVGNRTMARGESYDSASMLLADDRVEFSYNPAGNITKVTYPSGLEATYGWDVGGRQTSAVQPNGASFGYHYGVDVLVDEVTLGVEIVDPVTEVPVAVSLPLAAYRYDPDGRLVEEAILGGPADLSGGGLGGRRAWDYDPATGRLVSFEQDLVDPNAMLAGMVKRWETGWDRTGRLAWDCLNTDAEPCTGTDRHTTYGYDGAGQLLSAHVANPQPDDPESWVYSYGNRGERLSEAVDDGSTVVTTTYSHNVGLELVSAVPDNTDPAITFVYDQAGRRLREDDGTTVTVNEYDPRGRATTMNNTTVVYDPLGYPSGNIYFDYSGRDPLPRVSMLGTDQASYRFDWGNGLIGLGGGDYTATIVVYGYDHLGSITDQTGEDFATDSTLYDPYGNNIGDPGRIESYRGEFPLTYQGDYYLRNRNYDPTTATFTTPDPLDGVDGTPTVNNTYHYADNDPVNKTDPTGLRPTEGPCSEFSSTGAVIDAKTCDAALDLWEKRDRSSGDCAAIGGVNYTSGTCYLPPRSRTQKDFCFPPVLGDQVMSLGPDGICGVWSVEVRCARFSNFVTDPICRHREGILKVAGYALIPAAIAVTAFSGGAAGAPTASGILSLTSGSLILSAEAMDEKPCRSQRITVTAVLIILGAGVSGSFAGAAEGAYSAGGLAAGEAVTSAGIAGLEAVSFKC